MLKLLLLIPILGCVPFIFIKSESNIPHPASPAGPLAASGHGTSSPVAPGGIEGENINLKANSLMKQIALISSLLNLFVSIIL